MATWQVIANGTTYNLSDRNPFDVITVTGCGTAPVRRLTQRGPLQHGETDIGYRLDPRSVNLALAINATTLALNDAARDLLATIFSPRNNAPVQLRCTRDDGAVRQLDCYAVGMVEMSVTPEDRIGTLQRVAVQLQAADPLWYNPAAKTAALDLAAADVFSAGGMITAGSIIDSALAPAVHASIGDADRVLSAYTVYVRTTLDDDADTVSNLFNIDTSGFTIIFRWISSGINRQEFYGPGTTAVALSVMDGNLHDYFFVCYDSVMHVYEDDTLKAEFGTLSGITFEHAASYWRGSTNAEWDETVTHAAFYAKALSADERAGIIALANAPITEFSLTLTNAGSSDEFPIIVLTGPLVSPKVTNLATGEVLDFTGTTIAAGKTYTIDTRYGRKSVTDSDAVNRIAALSNASNLATFHLKAGVNLFTLSATSTDTNSEVTVYYYDRYMSL